MVTSFAGGCHVPQGVRIASTGASDFAVTQQCSGHLSEDTVSVPAQVWPTLVLSYAKLPGNLQWQAGSLCRQPLQAASAGSCKCFATRMINISEISAPR